MGPKWEAYCKASKSREEAERWLRLTKDKDHTRGGAFSLSELHASIKLTICGQHSPGSKNYWESPDALNKAILKVIHGDPLALISTAIDELKAAELAALIAAREEVEGVAIQIAEAEAAIAKATGEPYDAS